MSEIKPPVIEIDVPQIAVPKRITERIAAIAELRFKLAAQSAKVAMLEAEKADMQLRMDTLDALDGEREIQVWCADFTETLDGDVPTIEINGEGGTNVILLPGASPVAYSQALHGEVTPREIMSPEQAFFCAALLPGWQKFRPTYRLATIRSINYNDSLCAIDYDPATSSAQGLTINQTGSASDVPITYMDCDADAFEEGDRVVVSFDGQDWSKPRVIGFESHPRECESEPVIFGFAESGSSQGTPRKVAFLRLQMPARIALQAVTVPIPGNVLLGVQAARLVDRMATPATVFQPGADIAMREHDAIFYEDGALTQAAPPEKLVWSIAADGDPEREVSRWLQLEHDSATGSRLVRRFVDGADAGTFALPAMTGEPWIDGYIGDRVLIREDRFGSARLHLMTDAGDTLATADIAGGVNNAWLGRKYITAYQSESMFSPRKLHVYDAETLTLVGTFDAPVGALYHAMVARMVGFVSVATGAPGTPFSPVIDLWMLDLTPDAPERWKYVSTVTGFENVMNQTLQITAFVGRG